VGEQGEKARQVPWNKGHRKFNARRKQIFIDTIRETASAMKAAEAAGVCIDTAYAARREDIEFQARWEAAVEVALDQLLGEAYRRSMRGVDEPVIQGGQWVEYEEGDGERKRVTITRYSDRLLEVLLKFRYGDQLAERVKVSTEGPLGLEPEVLMRMEATDRRLLLGLLQKYAALARPELVEISPARAVLEHTR
jgi:hypothetical protein